MTDTRGDDPVLWLRALQQELKKIGRFDIVRSIDQIIRDIDKAPPDEAPP